MRRTRPASALVSVVVSLAACSGGAAPQVAVETGPAAEAAPADTAGEDPCPVFGDPETVGTIGGDGLTEISGLVAGWRNPDVLWVHEDSDGAAELTALTGSGAILRRYRLAGITARDWEDVTIGPGPRAGVPYLYVGDIGDNLGDQERFRIVRLPEPDVRAGTGATVTVEDAEILTGRYPDGPHDAEALMSDPLTGDLYVLTKEDTGPGGLYAWPAPQAPGSQRTLQRVGEVDLGSGPLAGDSRATAGDISRDGSEILVRTYTSASWWHRPDAETVAAAFTAAPCRVPLRLERQGEAIAWASDGSGYFSTSEGRNPPLSRYGREGDVPSR